TTGAVFMSIGQPGIVSRISLLQVALAAPLVYPMADRFGVTGVAVLFTIAYTMGSVYALHRVGRVLTIGVSDYASAVWVPLAAAGLAGVAAWTGFGRSVHAGMLSVAGTALAV